MRPVKTLSLAFNLAGDRLAAGFANGTVQVWSLPDGRELYRRIAHRPGSALSSLEFSRNGERIVTAGEDTTARVLDASSGRLLYTLRGHASSVDDAAFSSNGLWIVTAGRSTAGLWDRATQQRLLFLPGGEGRLLAASFDSSAHWVSTISTDGTLRRYACGVCGAIPKLLRLVQTRLASTGRELTVAERQRYLDTQP